MFYRVRAEEAGGWTGDWGVCVWGGVGGGDGD